ncbi:MAG: proline dehydrogenase family protein [Nitrososphaerota archaeon]|nr:proline dehydrogenase family protein [Nitrososphaerota archaeon]
MGPRENLLLKVARRWIAGVDMESAVKDALEANQRGYGVLINHLGEEIKDPATADAEVTEYLALQKAMADAKVSGRVSVKLTQFGLVVDEKAAAARLERVAGGAEQFGQDLWVDMEGSSVVDATLRTYLSSVEKHKKMGLALQAYMRRSESDLKTLVDRGAWVRLVKGAYREPSEIVFPTRAEISRSYEKLLEELFERGDHFAVATHDSKLVEKTKRLAESKHVDFEFEMLKGIRNELKEELAESGYKVSEYLPYGDSWMAYSRRRMTEHPSNVWLLVRSLF